MITLPPEPAVLEDICGGKKEVGKREPGGLAPCSIFGAVIDPTHSMQEESSWFLPIFEKGSLKGLSGEM